uniref:Uncharacterized protein n=1 Tax=Romanomermis culicivorax TaxID=13658 RepID=A0A915JRK8_ROMCU
MGLKRKAPGDDKLKPDKYQCMGPKSPGKFKVPRLPPAKKQQQPMQQSSSSTSQRWRRGQGGQNQSQIAKREAKARWDIIEEDLEEAIEVAQLRSAVADCRRISPRNRRHSPIVGDKSPGIFHF